MKPSTTNKWVVMRWDFNGVQLSANVKVLYKDNWYWVFVEGSGACTSFFVPHSVDFLRSQFATVLQTFNLPMDSIRWFQKWESDYLFVSYGLMGGLPVNPRWHFIGNSMEEVFSAFQ